MKSNTAELSVILEAMMDVYYRTDSNGICTYITPSVFELLGYEPSFMIGKAIALFYEDPEERNTTLEKLQACGGRLKGFETRLKNKASSLVWVSANIQFYYDENGDVAGVEGVARDISNQKQIENNLRQSEAKFRSIVENMMDTYYRTNAEGELVMMSPSVQELLGYSEDEILGTLLRDHYVDPSFRDVILKKLLDSGGSYRGLEAQLRHKDGRAIWVNTNASFVYDHGTVVGVEGTTRDITHDKNIAEELSIAKDRAEAASRVKTEFLSNMSHELRTPLTAILGFSKLLMEYDVQPLPAKVKEFAENIQHAGSHLSDLLEQILDLSKIEAGFVDVELMPVNLNDIISSCLNLMRPLSDKKNIELIFKCNDGCTQDSDMYVGANPMRLRQILLNLLSNAINYNRPDGWVSVTCRLLDENIELSIEDKGLGIPLEAQDDIFNPFTRAHSELNIEGSGIGLSVTRKNLLLMNSEIYYESVPGKGSRFWFQLPLLKEIQKTTSIGEENGRRYVIENKISVLYIEDNPLALRLMEEILGMQPNVKVMLATTGEDGYRMALQEQPDLVILDINLPDANGIDIMKRLKSSSNTRHIPVVALSASAMPDEVQQGLDAGFSRYLCKPSDPDHILDMIAELTIS